MRTYSALFLTLFLALTLSAACDNDSPTDRGSTSLPVETLARFASSGYAESQRLVIRDGGEMRIRGMRCGSAA